MKKIILLLSLSVLILIGAGFTAFAQVSTHHFEARNAFESFPALKQVEVKTAALKTMP
jgi:CHASE3 domain sensor protein